MSLTIAVLFMLARPQQAQVSSMLGNIQAESVADDPMVPPATATNTPPSPPGPSRTPTATPVAQSYAPLVFDTLSTPTVWLTSTAPPSGTATPTPPPGSTATFTPTPSATIPPDATPTVFVTGTVPAP
ncbi:MAG: hypothetical protein R3C43_05215 [Chloroflexota bacterium]